MPDELERRIATLEAQFVRLRKMPRWFNTDLVSEEPPTSSDVYVWNDTSKKWRPQSPTTVVVKASDETLNNNDTLQNDDELLFAIGASETWAFLVTLFVTGGSATPDIKMQFSTPAGAALFAAAIGPATGSAGFPTTANIPAPITEAASQALGVVSTTRVSIVISGSVVNSTTAGNVVLQWAQNTITAVDTIVKAGSTLVAWKV